MIKFVKRTYATVSNWLVRLFVIAVLGMVIMVAYIKNDVIVWSIVIGTILNIGVLSYWLVYKLKK